MLLLPLAFVPLSEVTRIFSLLENDAPEIYGHFSNSFRKKLCWGASSNKILGILPLSIRNLKSISALL